MKKLLFIIVATMMFLGCEEDESLISDFIEGSWTLSSYYRNDVNETQLINISSYTETYNSNGGFFRTYTDSNSDEISESGEYSIDEEKNTIHLTDVSSIDNFSDEHSTLSTSTIYITTFNETSLIYYFENGGDKHEFRFIKQ